MQRLTIKLSSDVRFILSRRTSDGSSSTDYIFFIYSGYLTFGTGSGNDCSWPDSSASTNRVPEPSRNTWHHVVGTISPTSSTAGQKTVWVDGQKITDCTYSGKSSAGSADLHVGTRYSTGSGANYFQNGVASVVTGDNLVNSTAAGTKVDESFNHIYAGVSDGEAADAGSNDVCMLFFDGDTGFGNGLGLGWKRSGADSQYARSGGNSGQDPTFDTTDNNADSGGNYAGVLCENSSNGDMRNNADGVVSCLVKAF